MLNSHLRNPSPQVAGITKSRHGQGSKRSRRKRRDESVVLPGHDRSVLPIHPHAGNSQSHQPEVDPIQRVGESAGEIDLQISRRPRPCQTRTENLQPDLRLSQARAQCPSRQIGTRSDGPGGEVLVVHGSAVAKQIQQHDPRKPHPVFRCGLDFCLVLIIDLAAQHLGGFFQRGDAVFQSIGWCSLGTGGRLGLGSGVMGRLQFPPQLLGFGPVLPGFRAQLHHGTTQFAHFFLKLADCGRHGCCIG